VDGGALGGRSKEKIGGVPGSGGPEAPREGALQEWKQPGQRGGTDPTVREPPWGRPGRRVFLSEASSVLCGLTTVAAALGVHTESSAASPLSRENSIGNSGSCRAPENSAVHVRRPVAKYWIQALSEARIREKRERSKGWKPRADGLKTITNAGSYGIFVEVNRKDRKGRVRIHGLGEDAFETEESEIEEPGSEYFPLLGTALTSASHLLMALADVEVTRLGGRVVYCDTDSLFVTPSKIAGQVSVAFAGLNPYLEPVAFLKDETEEKAPKEEYPKGTPDTCPRFFGLSSKRYCLFVRDRDGRPHVFRKSASDHGLGSYQVGKDRETWVAQLWERVVEKGVEAADDYLGIPATSEFSLSTPNLLPRIRQLGDIRPFTFLTARLLEPSKDPDAMRSELVAFVGPEDEAGRAALMAMPRQRSWGSVVEDFVRHHDWKYTFDGEGRAVRKHVLVRAKNLVGLGKEANRIEDSRVLGLAETRGRAKRYVDPDPFQGSATEVAERLGVSRRTVFNRRRGARD
jgi:hypothetical protein